ncbi:MAG: DUF2071 domain-containing protein [Bacteroidetes bacterium]|nr:DUF2071 domain-containing protein [Bacteroidota bacterium]
MGSVFLRAEWRKLMMANYAVDPNLLESYIPPHTELDLWNGKCYVSLVGFMFQNTRILGVKIPFHADFEEVNLRFYVKYNDGKVWHRGVVFLREIVPRPAVTLIANTLYGEKYATLRMRHLWVKREGELQVLYGWKKQKWHSMCIQAEPVLYPIEENSVEEFITEHYRGYTKLAGGKTAEYEVEHPRWEVYKTKSFSIEVDFGKVYGTEFDFLSGSEPDSVLLAEGSQITVRTRKVLQK